MLLVCTHALSADASFLPAQDQRPHNCRAACEVYVNIMHLMCEHQVHDAALFRVRQRKGAMRSNFGTCSARTLVVSPEPMRQG